MTGRSLADLRRDALAIWQAGVAAVQPARLVPAALRIQGGTLHVGSNAIALSDIGRILVVGGGKAGAAMAAAIEAALGKEVCRSKQVSGLVSVPADAISPTPQFIRLHAARPPGMNEPTWEGVQGAEEILRQVAQLGPEDLCICVISGGGSALLPAPAEGVSLADKLALTQRLAAAGANIRQLNTVRKHLSRIKGGRLAAACGAGRLISLIISDVAGDPVDLIASGPTVADNTTPADALAVLDALGLLQDDIAPTAIAHLRRLGAAKAELPVGVQGLDCSGEGSLKAELQPYRSLVTNLLVGNLATAVHAAAEEARRLGYTPETSVAAKLEGPAEDVGRELAARAVTMLRAAKASDCLISGGEPIVALVDPAVRGRGGRNQQLALAAGDVLLREQAAGCLLLSGGTDGEDGPTDAAGAWVDLELMTAATAQGLSPADHLRRNDAYSFFAAAGSLIRTGPTNTNVGDLRVVLTR
jgi:hydroxypyruvate reductase